MGVSSRFFEIGNFKKMDGDLNFWTELSLISFFGKCNEANSIVSGILFSLLLGAGRLESAPSCVAMMVKAVVQGYLLPTPPTPSGHLNTNRDCKKMVRLYHSWWSYATFGMKLTNFHVAAMAEAVNRDISLPRQDKERPTPPTHRATLIPIETVKNAVRCILFDEVMPFFGLQLTNFCIVLWQIFFYHPGFYIRLPNLTPAHLLTLPQSTV